MIKMILATSSKEDGYAIGKGNKLLWHVPEDLAYFKKQTGGQCVLLGRSTFDSINEILGTTKGLPKRKNLILSKTSRMSQMAVGSNLWLTSPKSAVKFIETTTHYSDLWVCGGASIYKQMLPHVSEIHHTLIKGEHEADTYFNMDFLNNGEWKLYSKEVLCDNATVNVWRRV